MSRSKFNISGQWIGHFQYGPEYGELYGEKVTFSFIIEELGSDQFVGKGYELEGVGANPGIATIKGYVYGNTIEFTKEYPVHYEIEQDGNLQKQKEMLKPLLTYLGEYNERKKTFKGTWEIEVYLGPSIHGDQLDICTGTWEMERP